MTENTEPSIPKPDHAYFLGSNDNPGTLITPIQLKDDNFDEWARAIRMSLNAKRKLGFLEGTIAKPTTPDKLADWSTVHSMLVSWLLNTISPNIRNSVSFYETAHELWAHLKERYCVSNGTRICQLKSQISDCKQQSMESLADYFGRLTRLWDELSSQEVAPTCSRGGAQCEVVRFLEQQRSDDRLHRFLLGRDDCYGPLRSNLLAQAPLPTVARAYQIVAQEERLRGTRSSSQPSPSDALAFKVDSRSKSRTPSDSVTCSNCHLEGHDLAGCFELIGYPEWWGDRPRGRRGGVVNRGGRAGRGRGGRGAPPARANKTVAAGGGATDKPSGGASMPRDPAGAGLAGISSDQWQNLLDLLNLPKPKDRLTGECLWIIDTGATHHVTGQFSQLCTSRKITGCPVGLPDGSSAQATHEGEVLVESDNCIVQFTKSLCVLQDRRTRTLIGAGEREDGLFFFRGVPTVKIHAVDGLASIDIWHKRLGHPSEKVLRHLPCVSPSSSSSCNKDGCDVCFRAHQPRTCFPRSTSRASRMFELIHSISKTD
ncbi:uncharacterized protein LOC130590685 [Beta vulgaris subsp. vulgaris]|uniref:uncharacterized protein LOC130590685 n=1 Tax=Beta vulgaris subsp. vulgaris TaxID=3555 RepID=UPI0025466A1E|nr:uncharacterized protein LOC130590685 [Beta vulgaris subsp. vulgaris]